MSAIRTEIHVLTSGISQDDCMQMSASIIKRYKIPTRRPLTLEFGARRLTMVVLPLIRSSKRIIRLTERTAHGMGLIDGDILRIAYNRRTQTIRLGPVIGILLPRAGQHADRPFGNITSFCKELHRASRTYGGIVYFFTPDDTSHEEIHGWRIVYDRFTRMHVPLPDIVYNRLTTRRLENKDSVQQFFTYVKSRHRGSIFNEKFLDKNEVFHALARNVAIHKHLPESHLLTRYEQLNTMCKRYGSVFLKPVTGSLGKGIIRVSRSKDRILCQYASLNGAIRKSYPSLSKAFSTIKSKVRGKRYLIQQGLTLITVQERPVDFRALVQKNDRNEWTITSIVGRIASNQSFVSNVARGGTMCTARAALTQSSLPDHLHTAVYKRLHKAALAIAQTLESEIPYHFAELGIDLAVDQAGRVWLLEVNSKPSKQDGTPLTDGKIRPSVKKLLQYSRFLSGM